MQVVTSFSHQGNEGQTDIDFSAHIAQLVKWQQGGFDAQDVQLRV